MKQRSGKKLVIFGLLFWAFTVVAILLTLLYVKKTATYKEIEEQQQTAKTSNSTPNSTSKSLSPSSKSLSDSPTSKPLSNNPTTTKAAKTTKAEKEKKKIAAPSKTKKPTNH